MYSLPEMGFEEGSNGGTKMYTSNPVLFRLWGKYQQPGEGKDSDFHPAVFHMLDVGMVARSLMPISAPRFARLLGCTIADAARWVAFFVSTHDIGKLAAGFQQKIDDPERLAVLESAGLSRIRRELQGTHVAPFDHGLQSVLVLTRWLRSEAVSLRCPLRDSRLTSMVRTIAAAVGAHHGSYHSGEENRKHRDTYSRYDRGGWAEVQDGALDWLAHHLVAPIGASIAPRRTFRRCSSPSPGSPACAIGSAPRPRTSP